MQAYEASLALVNSAEIKAEYEDLKARKGFRIVDHTIDADTASPRVCAQFSEELVKIGRRLRAVRHGRRQPRPRRSRPRTSRSASKGLEHGKHYSVTFRAGLPAAIGEVLQAPVTLDDLHPGSRRRRPASPATASCCRRRRGAAFRS